MRVMKKVLSYVIVIGLFMCCLCGCGSNVAGNESNDPDYVIVKDYVNTLLRPETFSLRDMMCFTGDVSYSASPDMYSDYTHNLYTLYNMHCTYEDANGVMGEYYVVFDHGNGKYYEFTPEEIAELGKRPAKVDYVRDYDDDIELFVGKSIGYGHYSFEDSVYVYRRDDDDREYAYEASLWDDEKIHKINNQIKERYN